VSVSAFPGALDDDFIGSLNVSGLAANPHWKIQGEETSLRWVNEQVSRILQNYLSHFWVCGSLFPV
jgi:hypothetical protein